MRVVINTVYTTTLKLFRKAVSISDHLRVAAMPSPRVRRRSANRSVLDTFRKARMEFRPTAASRQRAFPALP
jgi:hypothetical protein